MNKALAQSALKPRILIVDDENSIRVLVGESLEDKYTVFLASNSNEAMKIAFAELPAVVLLDIYMPGEDGVELCRKLRQHPVTRHIPIIMMTAMDARDTRIRSFLSGADDFLSKPFDLDELQARIASKLRRANERREAVFTFQNVSVDIDTLRASVDGNSLDLGVIEFKILSLLIRRAGALVRREFLESFIWGNDLPASRSLDTHIANLRKKLTISQAMLRTVYGEGFVLEVKV